MITLTVKAFTALLKCNTMPVETACGNITLINFILRLGCDRLLTSGQAASALNGSDLIRQLIRQNPEMEIVPGGGITENNLVPF